jgi:hypothetical protein
MLPAHWRPLLIGAVALMILTPETARAAACSVIEGDRDGNGSIDLRVLGYSGKQSAVIDVMQDGYAVYIDCNNNGVVDAADVSASGNATIETYSLELGGYDTITVRLAENLVGARKNVVAVLLGAVNKLTFQSQGFSLMGGSSLMLDVVAGGGSETVVVDFTNSTIDSSWVMVRGEHGAGNDTAQWIGAALTVNSTVDLEFFAGLGKNAVSYSDGGGQVVGSTIKYYAEGSDRGTDVDTFGATLAGTLDGGSRLRVGTNLLFGNDRFTSHVDLASFGIDPSGPAGSEAHIRVQGHRGFDQLTLTDDDTLGPATINGLFAVDFGGGSQKDFMYYYLRGITGSGTVRFRGEGGSHQDPIDVKVATDASSTNALDLVLQGGPEVDLGSPAGDVLLLELNDGGTTTGLFGAAAFLDGGNEGNDRCDFTGNGTHLSSGCELGTR